MKTVYKICFINVGLALLLTLLFTIGFQGNNLQEFIGIFGLVSFFGGAVDLLIGLVLLLLRKKEYGQGFLLSAGVLLLLGFTLCSTAATF